MSGLQAYGTTLCYPGAAPWTVVFIAPLGSASLLTFVLTFLRHFHVRFVILFYLLTYTVQRWLNYILQLWWAQPKPNQGCNAGLGMPALETQLVAFAVTFILAHALLWRTRLSWRWWVVNTLILTYTTLALPLTGNYTWAQVGAGIAVGAFTGVVAVAVLRYALWPHLQAVREWRVVRWTGLLTVNTGPDGTPAEHAGWERYGPHAPAPAPVAGEQSVPAGYRVRRRVIPMPAKLALPPPPPPPNAQRPRGARRSGTLRLKLDV